MSHHLVFGVLGEFPVQKFQRVVDGAEQRARLSIVVAAASRTWSTQ